MGSQHIKKAQERTDESGQKEKDTEKALNADALRDKIEKKTKLQDARDKQIGMMEGVSMLVQKGFDLEWLLYECVVDVFQKLILIATKQAIEQQRMLGYTMISAIGSLFSKKSSDGVDKILSDQIGQLEQQLRGNATLGSQEEGSYPGRQARSPRSSPNDIMRQLSTFHSNFSRMMGGRIPSLDAAIKRSGIQQQKAQPLPPE